MRHATDVLIDIDCMVIQSTSSTEPDSMPLRHHYLLLEDALHTAVPMLEAYWYTLSTFLDPDSSSL